MKRLRRLIAEVGGNAAVEFALVAPAFLALVFGIVNLSAVLYASAQLHYAAEDAARCYSVRTTVCTSATTAQTYAAAAYRGPGIGASFTAANTGACHHSLASPYAADGHAVTGTGTYQINAVLTSVSVPLSATACFP